MTPSPELTPIGDKVIESCRAVLDVMVAPLLSTLIRKAKDQGKIVLPGYMMSLHQAAAQFKLYTGEGPSLEEMEKTVMELMRTANDA